MSTWRDDVFLILSFETFGAGRVFCCPLRPGRTKLVPCHAAKAQTWQLHRPPRKSSFSGVQLSLFQSFLYNTDGERDKLSNTIEFWDGVPKYFVSRKEMHNLRTTDGFLPKVERTFQHGGRSFTVRIRPARVTDAEGRDQEFYPSAREELVEDALRKIAADQNYGFYEDVPENSRSGVVFSLHLLRKELSRRGHTLSFQQVMEALYVLSDAGIEIFTSDGKSVFKSAILPTLAGVSLVDLKNDPKARWYADFCPLVTESIRAMTYRQFDYHTMMQHTSQLARWLHKRLAHNYTNASYMTPYECLFSSVKRDSGLLEYQRKRDSVRKLDEALDELRQHEVLLSYEKQDQRGERSRILDVKGCGSFVTTGSSGETTAWRGGRGNIRKTGPRLGCET
jgi:hypothetical protein